MGGLRIDVRDLPLPMREQVAAQIVANYIRAAETRAQSTAAPPQKATVKKLRFPSRTDALRYAALKDAVREGVISDLRLQTTIGRVWAFTYQIQWSGEFPACCVSFDDLERWRSYGRGYVVAELTTDWEDKSENCLR